MRSNPFTNIMGKEDNSRNNHFLLYPHNVFYAFYSLGTNSIMLATFNLSSANFMTVSKFCIMVESSFIYKDNKLKSLPNDKFYTLPNSRSLQMTFSNFMKIVLQVDRKHSDKRRNCSLQAISSFLTVFLKDLFCRHVNNQSLSWQGLTLHSTTQFWNGPN